MKANKRTLMAVKSFLKNREGWDLDEVISEIVEETKLLKSKETGMDNLATDECMIKWGNEDICVLCEFIESFSEGFIQKICNILDSFVGEDLENYEFD